jgi:hypothetical protein
MIGDSTGDQGCHGIADDNPRTWWDLWDCVNSGSGGQANAFPGKDGCQQCVQKWGGSVKYNVEGTGVNHDCTWGVPAAGPAT